MCFKKKLWSIVLSAAMVLGTAIMPANMIFAASDNESQLQAMAVKSGTLQYGDSFKWTLDSKGTLKITGKGFLYLSLDDLGDIKNDIKKVVIGSGAKEIHFSFWSFSGDASLPKLAEISIPSTTKVLSGSLRECENLSVVTGGKNVEDIQGRVFEGTKWCQSTEHVVLGKTYIAYNGTGKNVVVPEGTVAVSEAAFQSNKTLEAVTLPVSVKKIGSYAFKDCSSLQKLYGGSSVSSVGYNAFLHTLWLDSLNETTMLGKVLMKYKATAKDYTVSEKVAQIYEGAFSKCDNLESVTIKGKITEIPIRAFENCTSLKKVMMPNTVTNIAYGAFDHCSALSSIKLPSSLQSIGTGAFVFCKSLSKVTIADGANNIRLTSIGTAAFGGCTKLKSLTIPKKVDSIENFAYGYDFNDEERGWFANPIRLSGVSITGVKKTKAEAYAKENNILFKSVKDDGTGENGSNYGYPWLIKEKAGTEVKAAEKKKNGLTAPAIEVNSWINIDATSRLQILHISKKVKGASGYQILWGHTGKSGSWSSYKDKIGRDFWNDSDGQKKKMCYYKVRAYKKVNGKTVYGPYSKVMKVK